MLPWFEYARRDPGALGIADCGGCYKNTPALVRQSLGCAFEPPPPSSVFVRAWDHPDRRPSPDEFENGQPKPQICPGYLCRLPQVIEVGRAHMHWSKGSLSAFSPEPSELLIEGIEVLEMESHALQIAIMTKDKKS